MDRPKQPDPFARLQIMALTVIQPWAHAIVHLGKQIENRDWPAQYRGWLAIHAGRETPKAEYEGFFEFCGERDLFVQMPRRADLVTSAIIGVARLTHCVRRHDSPWFVGDYGWVLENPIAIPAPVKCSGRRNLWGLAPELRQGVLYQIGAEMLAIERNAQMEQARRSLV